jgi:hypothetical protein
MADINPSLPIVGQPNSSEEPKVTTALSQVIATINALDTANLADGAVTAAKIEAQQAWQTTALAGLSGSLRYYKDSLGIVRVRGDGFSAAAIVTAGTTLLTLPAGYRPGVTHPFTVFRTDNPNQIQLQASISTAGVVVATIALAATPGAYSFAPLTFRAEN